MGGLVIKSTIIILIGKIRGDTWNNIYSNDRNIMHFIKLFGSGLNSKSSDPREKVWAEFHCSLCNEDTEIDVTGRRNTFQFDVERRCPKCGQLHAGDKALNLQAKLDKLTSDKSRIQIEIERLEKELNLQKIT